MVDEMLLFVRERSWVKWDEAKRWHPKTLVGVDVKEGALRYIDRLENIQHRKPEYFKRIMLTKIVDPENRSHDGSARV